MKRTVYNQYDSLVLPLQAWLRARGVRFLLNCDVTGLTLANDEDKIVVTGIDYVQKAERGSIIVRDEDLVFVQNGSMTDASSLGSMTAAPSKLTKRESGGWKLWESLADGRPQFGTPSAFNGAIAQSCWESFTVTLTTAHSSTR